MRGFLKNRPWSWVGTLYFAEAVPYAMVNGFFIMLLKDLDYPDATTGFWAAMATWPWVIKPLWAPLLDIFWSKRRWIVIFQSMIAVLLVIAALTLWQPDPLIWLVIIFSLVAFASSSHDIAADGFYIEGLTESDQSLYCGLRSAFYRLGMIAVNGGLLSLIGLLNHYIFINNELAGWSAGAVLAAGTMALLALWHLILLPRPSGDTASLVIAGISRTEQLMSVLRELRQSFATFFRKPGVFRVIGFILLFRLAEAMLVVLSKLFFRADSASGGLGLSLEQYGTLYGTIGAIWLIIGGMLAGVAIYRFGLGRCMLPMALALNIPDIAYVLLAHFLPESMFLIGAAVSIEQFGYGFGFTAFTLLLVSFAEDSGRFKTSHFSFMTGFMALGMMLPGLPVGKISDAIGYYNTFWLIMACTIPATAAVWLVKNCYPVDFGRRKNTGE